MKLPATPLLIPLILAQSIHQQTLRLTIDSPGKAIVAIAIKATAYATVTQTICAQTSLPTPPLNLTEPCDSSSSLAQDCRVASSCDTSAGLYSTCDAGECRCLAKPCREASACTLYRQCRGDSEEPSCEQGVCGCRPRVTDCQVGGEEEVSQAQGVSPHEYCGARINCTEAAFSLYPEFPRCVGDEEYPGGRCACAPVECDKAGSQRDYEVCRGLISCGGSEMGGRPYCNVKYGSESRGRRDGYCTCV